MASKPSMASSTLGSSATSTAWGAAARTAAESPAVGSATSTSSAPACLSADCRLSQAGPGRASSTTRLGASDTLLLLRQQFEHVAQQFVLLVRLAQVAVDADFHCALAMLLAGTRSDHDDRHVAQARLGLHRGRQLVAVHARHFDVEQ